MDNQFYLGIDLDDAYAIVSYYETDKPEPETVSTVAGSEVFQIPVLLTKKRGIGQWFIGEDAVRLAAAQEEAGVDRLLSRALHKESVCVDGESHPASELLRLYLKKLILLAGSLGKRQKPDCLVLCLEELSREASELFGDLAPGLGISREQLILLDRRECFYYFVYHQDPALTLHDVWLYDYRGEELCCRRLEKERRTTPQLITLTEESVRMPAEGKDTTFLRVLKEQFQGRIVSATYLVGDGFDGGWMKRSVAFLCQGRRAFVGKNLYSKGACYAAAVLAGGRAWNYVYLGDNEMKVNVSLRVLRQGKPEFYTLIGAGTNWYDATGRCEVILDGTPEVDFWLQPPNSREAKVEHLELSDLPKRPERATRLRITAKPMSDVRVKVQIRDLGFGEIFRASDKVWEYVMTYEEES